MLHDIRKYMGKVGEYGIAVLSISFMRKYALV